MKSGTYLLVLRPTGVEGGNVGEFMLLLDGISVGDRDTILESTVSSGLNAAMRWWSTKVQSTRERQG